MISYRRSVFIAPAIWLGALIFSTLGVRGEQAPAPPVATRAGQAPASDMFALLRLHCLSQQPGVARR